MFKHSLILGLSILLTPLSYSMNRNAPTAQAVPTVQTLFVTPVAVPPLSDTDKQLIEAAKIGDVATMQDLIVNHGANVNATLPVPNPSDPHYESLRKDCYPGSSSLYWAIKNGHVDAVRLLLDHNVSSGELQLPLLLAMEFYQIAILKLLLQKASQENIAYAILHSDLNLYLSREQTFKVLETLYAFNSNFDSPDFIGRQIVTLFRQQLHNLSDLNRLRKGDEGFCRLLAAFIVAHSIALNNSTSYHYIVEQAYENQARLNRAVAGGKLQEAVVCLHAGAYCTPIAKSFVAQKLFAIIAADNRNALIVLLKLGCGLYACDDNGDTLLHAAIKSRSNKVAGLLIYLLYRTQHLDKHLIKQNKAGLTPFALAVQHGANHPIIQALCWSTKLPESADNNDGSDSNTSTNSNGNGTNSQRTTSAKRSKNSNKKCTIS